MTVPLAHRLVAHRGYPARYPENSLIGIEAALELGARWVELDVQVTADGVPVAVHDLDLMRVAGRAGVICETCWADLGDYDIGEGRRFGKRFLGTRVSRLYDIVERVLASDATAFVEVKAESLDCLGAHAVMSHVVPVVERLGERGVIICFEEHALEIARRMGFRRVGWVLKGYDDQRRRIADALEPEFLFCNRRRLPRFRPLWPGPWRWAVYVVDSPSSAARWVERGADLVETDRIGDMLRRVRRR